MRKKTTPDRAGGEDSVLARAPVSRPPEADSVGHDRHVVDELIEERCPHFTAHWSWPVVRPLLYSLFSYKKARYMADRLKAMNGQESFDYLAGELSARVTIDRLARVPSAGPLMVVGNHPTGLADGVVAWQVLRRVRKDIVFFANSDALRVNRAFLEHLIPVEWVIDKRTPGKTRATLLAAKAAISAEKCVVIFPSGKLAKKDNGVLTEQEWMPSAISLACKYRVPVQPLNIRAFNSRLYYFCSRLNDELRDIMLFHELLNKKNKAFTMTFGPLILPDQLSGNIAQLTLALRDHVCVQLGRDPDLQFRPLTFRANT